VRLRAGIAALVAAAATVAPVVAAPTPACAQSAPRAVLVVDTGSQVVRYCVALDDESVSGTDLIVLASRQYGLSYRFGYGGGAVCMLAGVGTSGDDCFEEYPDFWGYWRGDGSGGWTWSSTGAASTTVSNGDVEGWSWGSGNDGSTHPAPPPTGFDAVCPEPRKPRPDRDDAKDKKKPAESDTSAPSPSTSPAASAEEEEESDGRSTKPDGTRPASRRHVRRDSGRVAARTGDVTTYTQPAPASSPRPIAATPSSGSGPPPAGLAGVAAAVLLVAAGIAVRRRSRASSAEGN
jgi:hypothetical protein